MYKERFPTILIYIINSYELQIKVGENEKLTDLNSEHAAQKLPEYDFVDHQVKNGDNLAIIFKRAGFSAQTLYKLVNTNAETRKLTKIHLIPELLNKQFVFKMLALM